MKPEERGGLKVEMPDGRVVTLEPQARTSARSVDWVVVTCPWDITLEVVEALEELGVKAWTPRYWVKKRLPRRKLRVWAMVGVLPGYIFLRTEDLPAYRDLPKKEAPFKIYLRPMTVNGKVVVLSDDMLEGLREFDQPIRPEQPKSPRQRQAPGNDKAPEAKWEVGDKVLLMGVVQGEGEVDRVLGRGKYRVALNYSQLKVEVSGFLLRPLGDNRGQSAAP